MAGKILIIGSAAVAKIPRHLGKVCRGIGKLYNYRWATVVIDVRACVGKSSIYILYGDDLYSSIYTS